MPLPAPTPSPLPARNTLAVIGAGPIGLETALAALDAGFDVHVFERGEVGSHPIAWGHVRMFTPWRMNLGPVTRAHLQRTDWAAPPDDECPTGQELNDRALLPASRLPELANRVHAHSKVIHVSRRGALKGEWVGKPERREFPFRLLVRSAGGRENFLHAFAVVDASGTYGQPNWAGLGGIPARQELYVAPQLSYHLDDVRGLRRERYAGKRVMVIGSGLSAATVVSDLVALGAEAPGTTVLWVTRESRDALYAPLEGDPLAGRRALMEEARGMLGGAHPLVAHLGGAGVEGFEFNSATHRYRVALSLGGDDVRLEEVDHVIINTGYRPDDSIYRELQIHECYATSGTMKLATTLTAAGADCLKAPTVGIETLLNPEPDFYIAGAKSFGRNGDFLLEIGYRQVAEIVARLAKDCAKPVGV
jgi:thioredoxin reductase